MPLSSPPPHAWSWADIHEGLAALEAACSRLGYTVTMRTVGRQFVFRLKDGRIATLDVPKDGALFSHDALSAALRAAT